MRTSRGYEPHVGGSVRRRGGGGARGVLGIGARGRSLGRPPGLVLRQLLPLPPGNAQRDDARGASLPPRALRPMFPESRERRVRESATSTHLFVVPLGLPFLSLYTALPFAFIIAVGVSWPSFRLLGLGQLPVSKYKTSLLPLIRPPSGQWAFRYGHTEIKSDLKING